MKRMKKPVPVLGEHREQVIGLRARRLLAARVVRLRLEENGGEIGPRAHQFVVDRDRVGDAGESAGFGLAQAHQPDQVGAVGVIVERDLSELVAAERRIVERACPGR